jgi:hypothetical protein
MTVTIGIDPHKSSHTAVAIDANETVIDQIKDPIVFHPSRPAA